MQTYTHVNTPLSVSPSAVTPPSTFLSTIDFTSARACGCRGASKHRICRIIWSNHNLGHWKDYCSNAIDTWKSFSSWSFKTSSLSLSQSWEGSKDRVSSASRGFTNYLEDSSKCFYTIWLKLGWKLYEYLCNRYSLPNLSVIWRVEWCSRMEDSFLSKIKQLRHIVQIFCRTLCAELSEHLWQEQSKVHLQPSLHFQTSVEYFLQVAGLRFRVIRQVSLHQSGTSVERRDTH